ncbi:ABC transporter ATP-binding protein [Olsenella sp. YH-ols2217]|uniref:ABC transporter ATP-binding protein n=1 Tax=Kribbibacterium absianum TaxID=3044210 RepID=A0ABT6ZJM1_9ACTN|nr:MULTISPECIES: ABC transporter ATP-binding protein [unclassified Olsenella]MDJ1122755.1 ABC transporter ATP-binding protein [Olsenella sp. YH-ols2216]MDJ1129262.1 ABC transporter ATP-binding protein [Olsenella sp. YH-ols2217]
MLRTKDVAVGFGKRVLVRDACLSLAPGQIKGLIAPNGTGKTTLMRYVAGNKRLGTGRVEVDGTDLWALPGKDRPLLYVAGDGSGLYGHLNAVDHLHMVKDLWHRDLDVRQVVEKCGLAGFARRPVRKLSQGMRQTVSLCLGYAAGARYLLLDEPMNASDPTNIAFHSRTMRALAGNGVGILYSSHLLENVSEICDSVFVLREGRLQEFENSHRPGCAQALYRGCFMRDSQGREEPREQHAGIG